MNKKWVLVVILGVLGWFVVNLSVEKVELEAQLQSLRTILNDVWDNANNRLMTTPGVGAQGVFESEITIFNDVWDASNHMLRVSGGGGAGSGDFSSNTATSVDSEVVLFSGTAGKTGKRATGTGLASLTSGVLSTVAAPTGDVVGTTDTQTLSAKRVNPRAVAYTDQATVTINADTTDIATLASLSQTTNFANPTGTPVNGQPISIRIVSASSQSVTWGTAFAASAGGTLPSTTTGGGNVDYFDVKWNSTSSKWEFTKSAFIFTPTKIWLPVAACQNTTATLLWDVPTTNAPVAACVTGSNVQKGVADFANTANLTIQTTLILPSDWNAGAGVDVKVKWMSTQVDTNSVVWQIESACTADAETDDPAFVTSAVIVDAAKGVGNPSQTNDATATGITMTGCAAGELWHFRVRRDTAHASDTHNNTARLTGVEITLRRTVNL